MISPSHLTAPSLNIFPMGENEDVDISKSLWILSALNTDFPQQTVQVTFKTWVLVWALKKKNAHFRFCFYNNFFWYIQAENSVHG